LNNYAKGVYVVDIKNKKGIFTQKIFLQWNTDLIAILKRGFKIPFFYELHY
jgi:hypothetical protein